MTFDIIVVGSGPGGYVAAIRAAQLGLNVAIVEKEQLGGVCLNWGCIPTKSLLQSAKVLTYVQEAEKYGITTGQEAQAKLDKMIDRSRSVAQDMSKGVDFLMKKNKIQVLQGRAEIDNEHRVRVIDEKDNTTIYDTQYTIIATGAKAAELSFLKPDGKKILTYKDALALKNAPKSIAIVGAGAIGVEFAHFYLSIGVEVHLIESSDQILPMEDKDISKKLTMSFKRRKMHVLTKTKLLSVNTDSGDNCILEIETKGKKKTLKTACVLSAVGIKPNTSNIGLEKAGVKTTNGYIKVDSKYQSTVPHIYAIGDVINTISLAHVASVEAIACVEHIAGKQPTPIQYDNIPSCTYCQPEVASVGITEQEAHHQKLDIGIGIFPFAASGKATALGKKEGMVKLIVDKKYGEILGAHLVGENVTELIGEIVSARQNELSIYELIQSVHPHPTLSEALVEAASQAIGECIHL